MSHFLFSPFAWGLLVAIVLALGRRRLPRWARIAGVCLLAGLVVLCTPLGANALLRSVETQAPRHARCGSDARGPIIVLSGGFERPPRRIDDYAALNPESWRRLQRAVEHWHAQPASALWITGGGPYAFKEGDVLARLARDWGVPRDRLHVENRSTTTWESAQALRAQIATPALLVTSAVHLPRALMAFDAAGIAVCGDASDSNVTAFDGPGYFLPQVSAMEKAEDGVYEWIGMAAYAWRARRESR